MRRFRGSFVAVGALVVVAAAGLWGWSASTARFERARDRAIDYFATHVQQADPAWMHLFGYLHRRFGLVATLASGHVAHDASAGVGPPSVFEVYRRVDDPMASIGRHRIAQLAGPIDRMTASALHCDRIPLQDDWIDVLRRESLAGGYALTQAVLASEWTIENGCRTRQDVAPLRADQIAGLVTLIHRRHELADQFDSITAMWIEAMGMLHYIGAGDMVRDEWMDELVNLQNDDGGWPRSPKEARSDSRATAVALWVLLEHQHSETRRTPWIQQIG